MLIFGLVGLKMEKLLYRLDTTVNVSPVKKIV